MYFSYIFESKCKKFAVEVLVPTQKYHKSNNYHKQNIYMNKNFLCQYGDTSGEITLKQNYLKSLEYI